MVAPTIHAIVLSALVTSALAVVEPAVTAAPRLHPRQSVDPALVGYLSANGGYENGRTCDYPQTMSTSGSFARCCPTSGACPFYTACSSNTLLAAASASGVPCDVNPGLTCNTAVLATTAGASGGASYLACWQATLGSSAFTFVQDIGSATVAAAATSTKGSGSSSVSQAPTTATNTASQSSVSTSSAHASITSSESSASTSATAAAGTVSSDSSSANSASAAGSASASRGHGFENIVVGAVAFLARFLL